MNDTNLQTIEKRLQRMDEHRDEARTKDGERLTVLEIQATHTNEALKRIEDKVDKQSKWLNGNGDPSHGLISMTQTTNKLLLEHLEICKLADFEDRERRLMALEKHNFDETERAKKIKNEAYSLLKPSIAKVGEFLIKMIVLVIAVALLGEPVIAPILKTWLGVG